MNKNFIVCMMCLGMLLSITGFVLATDSTNYPVLSCTNGVNGCDAQILVGDKFSISLDGNASTGYQWNLSYDTTLLNLDSSNSVSLCPPVSSGGIDMIGVGCGQTTNYNFSALKAGIVKITATYSRPWESIQPTQINYYNINISTASINGVCGSANGMTFSSIPTINLCSIGISSPSLVNPWGWTCSGLNGGSSVNCAAYSAINGVCGSAINQQWSSAPTTNLCASGTPSAVQFVGSSSDLAFTWNWSCTSPNGGSNTNCSASLPPTVINGVCGSANGASLNSIPTTNLCATGTTSSINGSGPWTWICNGLNGGISVICKANKSATNSVCGSANGMTFSSIPTTNLCASGTASSVSGSGPWTWSCNGSTTSSCSALVQLDNNLKLGSLTLDKPLSQMSRNELLMVLIRLLYSLYRN